MLNRLQLPETQKKVQKLKKNMESDIIAVGSCENGIEKEFQESDLNLKRSRSMSDNLHFYHNKIQTQKVIKIKPQKESEITEGGTDNHLNKTENTQKKDYLYWPKWEQMPKFYPLTNLRLGLWQS